MFSEEVFEISIYQLSILYCLENVNKNTLPLTETRKRKGVELVILLSYQSQHVRTRKAGTYRYSA